MHTMTVNLTAFLRRRSNVDKLDTIIELLTEIKESLKVIEINCGKGLE